MEYLTSYRMERAMEMLATTDLMSYEVADAAGQHADIVKSLEAEADRARRERGDALTKRAGQGVREPGRMAQD